MVADFGEAASWLLMLAILATTWERSLVEES
jgi:hypothetical protein